MKIIQTFVSSMILLVAFSLAIALSIATFMTAHWLVGLFLTPVFFGLAVFGAGMIIITIDP